MVGSWLTVAGAWAAIVAAATGLVIVAFGWSPWRENRRRPSLDLRVVGPAGFMTTEASGQEIVQAVLLLELTNRGRGPAKSWFVRFEFPVHPSGSGITSDQVGRANCSMSQEPDGTQVLVWHAADQDDLLIPRVPKTFNLGMQLRGGAQITIPLAVAAERTKGRSGRITPMRSDRSVDGTVEWD
jgi:hypothetical protein